MSQLSQIIPSRGQVLQPWPILHLRGYCHDFGWSGLWLCSLLVLLHYIQRWAFIPNEFRPYLTHCTWILVDSNFHKVKVERSQEWLTLNLWQKSSASFTFSWESICQMILWQTDFHLKQIQVCWGSFFIFSMEQFVIFILANLIFLGKN